MWITFLHNRRGLWYTNYTNMESVFITKIIRVGTSNAVVIPVEILNGYHWQRGDILIFGFAGSEQLLLKRLTDKELKELKPHDIS